MIRIYLTQIFNKKKLIIKGSKNRYRDLLYITDCINYLNKIILNKFAYDKIINIGSGKKYFIFNIVKILKKNIPFKFIVQYEKKTVDDQFGIIANNDQLKKITNYYPKTDLNDGVKKMIKNLNY